MADQKILKQIIDLINKGYGASFKKEMEQARQYFDEAISMAETHNITSYGLRLDRELYLRTSRNDLHKEIPILQDALAFYKQQKRPLKLVKIYERLIRTLALLNRREQVYFYLDEAGQYFSSLGEEDISMEDIPAQERSKLISIDKQLKIRESQARMQHLRDAIPSYFPSGSSQTD